MLPRMDTQSFDVIVVGAGIAGGTAAAHLAPDHRVALLEMEEAAGYHTTGRSAALWIGSYGPPDGRVLAGLSRSFLESPPPEFAAAPLMTRRPVLYLVPAEQETEFRTMLAQVPGVREISVAEAHAMLPALKPGYPITVGIEPDSFDVDVAALHQGYLRRLRGHGGTLALRSRADSIERHNGEWHVTVSGGGVFIAPVLVNSAGAWGDEVARLAGAAAIGLQPKRRTVAIIDPGTWEVAGWPTVNDLWHTWYSRPEARTKLLVSPADETPMHPHDVRPEELDIAIGIDRMQRALDIEVRRVEHSWAGLRTFTPDGSFAIGWDGAVEGFFWYVGQGGFGIQTSKAAGQLVADVISGRDPGPAGAILERVNPRRFAAS
jgi:D-arginine dehydrogenase